MNTAFEFETESTKISHEKFDVMVSGQVVGTITHEIRHFLDSGALHIASGKLVIEHASRQSFTDLAAFTEFSYTTASNTPAPWQLPIFDFRIPKALQGLGVARFIWHLISQAIPPDLRLQIRVQGALSQQNATQRRDALFKDVCGMSTAQQGATFEASALNFSGPLTDPWQEARAKFQPVPTQISRLSTSAQSSQGRTCRSKSLPALGADRPGHGENLQFRVLHGLD